MGDHVPTDPPEYPGVNAWLTPDSIPTGTRCRSLHIPDDDELESCVAGALLLLADPDNWEEFGSATPEDTAYAFLQMCVRFNRTEVCMPIGSITPFAGDSAPEYFLLCDGSEYAQDDYPALYAVIGSKYGAAAAGNFKVPDYRGRSLIGAGPGPGLTNRAAGSSGGAESVSLTAAQNGPHNHTTQPHAHGYIPALANLTTIGPGAPEPTAVPGAAITDLATVIVDSSGSGDAHENMPPWAAEHWIIRAK